MVRVELYHVVCHPLFYRRSRVRHLGIEIERTHRRSSGAGEPQLCRRHIADDRHGHRALWNDCDVAAIPANVDGLSGSGKRHGGQSARIWRNNLDADRGSLNQSHPWPLPGYVWLQRARLFNLFVQQNQSRNLD